jgi:hypothetical protein
MAKWQVDTLAYCPQCHYLLDDNGFCVECLGEDGYPDEDYGEEEDPLSQQVGGTHYKDMAIQPIEFILANNLPFCEGNIIKYTCRYKQKNGVEDLRKVIHYAEMLIASLED